VTLTVLTLTAALTIGNGQEVDSRGASFEFLTANRSIQTNDLVVTIKVTSGSQPLNIDFSPRYRAPDGKQREAAETIGPYEVDAESNTITVAIFPAAQTGGTVTLSGCVADCDDFYEVTLNVG
jgi:hypothetical protein